ncbi:MAG: HAD family phosphatase [Phycisphaerales bacterium]|nr:HAD family phosphatase [Phycisphaerales bacterium]
MPAAIFDLDGTLIDSWSAHYAAWRGVAAGLGHDLSEADFTRQFGMKNEPIIETLHLASGHEAPDDAAVATMALDKERRYRAEMGQGEFAFMPGVLELLRSMHAQGWHLAIGSSAPRENIDFALAHFSEVGVTFDAVACGCDVKNGKPAPDVFLLAASRLGVEPEACIVFEDAPPGVEAAARAGMACVGVASRGRTPEELSGAQRVIGDFQGLTPDSLTALL